MIDERMGGICVHVSLCLRIHDNRIAVSSRKTNVELDVIPSDYFCRGSCCLTTTHLWPLHPPGSYMSPAAPWKRFRMAHETWPPCGSYWVPRGWASHIGFNRKHEKCKVFGGGWQTPLPTSSAGGWSDPRSCFSYFWTKKCIWKSKKYPQKTGASRHDIGICPMILNLSQRSFRAFFGCICALKWKSFRSIPFIIYN